MKRIVLIGENIAHSQSPALHNRLFARYNQPYQYELMPVTAAELPEAIQTLKAGSYRGANVTSPHKQNVLRLLDALTEEAVAIGAVNTIVIDDGRTTGHNTDAEGFALSLQGCPWIDSPFTAAILGTGGAARAAVYSLLKFPMLQTVTVYSRQLERALQMGGEWNDVRVIGESLEEFHPSDLVVHATPVGLAGHPGQLLQAKQLRGVGLLYEMIYDPAPTQLSEAATHVGVEVINGMNMLLLQALASFRLWTGES